MEERKHKYRKEGRGHRDRYCEKQRNGEMYSDKDRSRRDRDSQRFEREKSYDGEDRYGREYPEKEREKKRERETEIEVEYQRRDKREREKDINRERRIRKRERSRDVGNDDRLDDVGECDRKKHRRDGGGEKPRKNSEEYGSVKKEKKPPICEELEDEEGMEKRRRRVQQWRERMKEETQRENCGEGSVDELNSGETWTPSDDDDKEVPGDVMLVGSEPAPALQKGDDSPGDEELDPLDAFMNSMLLPEVNVSDSNKDRKDKKDDQSNGEQLKRRSNKSMGRIIPGEDSDSDYGDLESDDVPLEDEADDEFIIRAKMTKTEKSSAVDHSKIDYKPFRRAFYSEVKEISRMSPEEVAAYRKQLELKIHGKDVPKPIKTWPQTGLTNKSLQIIKKLKFEKPLPIQAQALPVIMSGRDCIGIGKTGSGKTLAYVLPMLRHIKDQPPVVSGDGPVGLIMAPTRELVQQIHSDIKKFSKVLGFRCVSVYGGYDVAQQISELKRGAEIVVCTPGRMIDILFKNGGKITNLRTVTYLVMDEADRMFDCGFEPQITRIVQDIRPDRQTVLFSATFPLQVELLARKVLDKPVEIQVGGRSIVNKDIMQLVEVRPENERFLRLLELLGDWYEKGKILIFVQTHDKCDALFRDLLRHRYPCLSLHGGKDQTDRESAISDFKSHVCNLLISTSVAARGLDVKELELVINFDVPNHYEDYVHRVGRTGRAGRKGCAITFISEEDARYAPDLVKALQLSGKLVPDDLKSLADNFMAKVKQGLEHAHGTGYGGSGFKFNEEEDEMRRAAKKSQAKEYGCEYDMSDSEDGEEGVQKAGDDISRQGALSWIPSTPSLPVVANDGAARALEIASTMHSQHNLAKMKAMPEHYAELEINHFPLTARRIIHDQIQSISELTGAAITRKGKYFPPGNVPGPGDRKLYLFIEGPTEQSVKNAKAEFKRALEVKTNQAFSLPGRARQGRYQVI